MENNRRSTKKCSICGEELEDEGWSYQVKAKDVCENCYFESFDRKDK